MKRSLFFVLLITCLLSLTNSCSIERKSNHENKEASLESTVYANNEVFPGEVRLLADSCFIFKKCEVIDNVYIEVYEANDGASSYDSIVGRESVRELLKFQINAMYRGSDRLNELSENETDVCYRLVWPGGSQLDYIFPFNEVKEIAELSIE